MKSDFSTQELLSELIRIPSVNPDGDPGTDQIGEERIAQYLGELLEPLGGEIRFQEVLPQRPNVFARFPIENNPKYRILLAPHSDTVSVAGMTIPPFSPEIQKGKIYGRGACDTKGPMAAMIRALLNVVDSEDYQSGNVEFTFVAFMGEETGCVGSNAFAETEAAKNYDFAIVAEPTESYIVHAHKGCAWVKIETRGKAAHASVAQNNDNSNLKMAHVLVALENNFLPWLEETSNATLGVTSAVPSLLNGGSKANIAPAECSLTLDIRTIPNLSLDQIESKLNEVTKSTGINASVHMPKGSASLDTDAEHPLVKAIEPATRGLTTAPWFCDAAALASVGVPSVAMGPGSIAQAHTKDEWITLEELDHGTKCYERSFQNLVRA
ncbi:MAG: M20 family metallopeptidase [Verrucomicrobiota bacterium]